MSKPRIIFEAVMDSETHSQQARDFIVSKLVGKDIFENHGVSFYFDEEINEWVVRLDIRFNIRSERDDLETFIKDRVLVRPQTKNWFKSVKESVHTCSHDDIFVKDCKTTEYFEWNK